MCDFDLKRSAAIGAFQKTVSWTLPAKHGDPDSATTL